MHELSIAISIVEMAEEAAERHAGSVAAVHLKLGRLSGVVKEALLSSYEMACQDTPLAGSRLLVEELPIIVYCAQCQARHQLNSPQWLCCPVCGAPTAEVVQGRELEVSALEMQ
jgi:hydrogenase nickel incorporation protein HypA/HybF